VKTKDDDCTIEIPDAVWRQAKAVRIEASTAVYFVYRGLK